MIIERAKGVVAALGRDTDWYRFFDVSPRGFRASFLVALLTLPAYAVIARGIEVERALITGAASKAMNWPVFALVMLGFTLAFPFVAVVSSTLFQKAERLHGWVVARHWAVFIMAWVAAGGFALYLGGRLPYALANLLAFGVWFGILAADIRLAQKVGGFGLGAAILVGSIITSLGMSLVLMGLLLYVGG